MPIDSHVHLYPSSVSQDPAAWAAQRGESYWLSCVQPATGIALQAWRSVEELLRDMDEAGIEKAVILAWYWENHDSCLENLSWQAEWLRLHPDRFVCFAPFNANGGPAAVDSLRAAFESGFRGVGELNPPAQGYAYDDPILGQALDLAAQHEATVNFHVTDPTTHTYPGKVDTPYSCLLTLARTHPGTQFVLSHLGGGEPLRHQEDPPENLAFDTAACPLLYKVPVYRAFCDRVGAGKVLFGTDYPLRVFPRDRRSPDFTTPLAELRCGNLSEAEFEAITSENAKRILKLS